MTNKTRFLFMLGLITVFCLFIAFLLWLPESVAGEDDAHVLLYPGDTVYILCDDGYCQEQRNGPDSYQVLNVTKTPRPTKTPTTTPSHTATPTTAPSATPTQEPTRTPPPPLCRFGPYCQALPLVQQCEGELYPVCGYTPKGEGE